LEHQHFLGHLVLVQVVLVDPDQVFEEEDSAAQALDPVFVHSKQGSFDLEEAASHSE